MRSTEPLSPSRFHVSVHDVAAVWERETEAIFAALAPLVGPRFSAAVVPCWHGLTLQRRDSRLIAGRAGEVLLHGWRHRRERGRGPVSVLTGGADEFAGLRAEAAVERLRRGRDLVSSVFGCAVEGFLPPAFRRGPVDTASLIAAGLRYRVGWASARDISGRTVPLATTVWDVSPLADLSRVGAPVGRLVRRRPGAVPVITVHPLDVRRGLLPAVVAEIEDLLRLGARPALVRDLLAVA
ncbi:hypothetical protein ACWEVD_04725 [Nocardia thailandica]|uniref:DUF2334 domain-containing protein n=1 Tax=Nocardia thailandica TaxID=257275 RepID=A0ABW6PVF6_9NOCA